MKSASREPLTGFIIDNYSPYQRNNNVISVFKIHGVPYCIREINEFDWGQPVFPEKNIDDDFNNYCVYDTIEEAQGYVRYLKRLEGSRVQYV